MNNFQQSNETKYNAYPTTTTIREDYEPKKSTSYSSSCPTACSNNNDASCGVKREPTTLDDTNSIKTTTTTISTFKRAKMLNTDEINATLEANYRRRQDEKEAAELLSLNGGGLDDGQSNEFRNGATLRERNRMHILNDAFDELRKIVPKMNLSEHQRLSKIATLRLAIQYIDGLTRLLQTSGGCRPVDASLLPQPPRRRRKRKSQQQQQLQGGVQTTTL